MSISQNVIENLFSSISKIDPWAITKKMMRIDITEDCDLNCITCNKMCGVAKSTNILTLEQLDKFTNEMTSTDELKKKVPNILFITGGEPTTHPQFSEILDKLDAFSKVFEKVFCMLITNIENEKSDYLRDRVFYSTFHPVGKSRLDRKVIPILEAPIDYFDFGNDAWRKGCRICTDCGITFSRSGYYMCPIANSIDRIFGFDLGAKSFNDLTLMKILQQREAFCKYCGYFFLNTKSETEREFLINNNEESVSETWKQKLQEYTVSPPKLTTY